MNDEIKPCPFCGSVRITVYEDKGKPLGEFTYTFCHSCQSRGPSAWKTGNDEDAYDYTVKLWNKRVFPYVNKDPNQVTSRCF